MEGTEATQHYSICGSLCTTNDIMIGDLECRTLRTGDVLAFGRAGAYSVYEGMSLFLSHELPGVVLWSEETGFMEVRRQSPTYSLNTPVIF